MSRAITERKQASTHEDWLTALATVEERIPYPAYADLRDRTAARIRERGAGRRLAYGWSGGKDSQALRVVAELAGVTECVLVISDLEYPAFLAWATSHMPEGLTVEFIAERNLAWLAAHPEMLFPKDATTAAKWFRLVQHTGQARYYRAESLDAILLGRRRSDGNFVGRNGQDHYTSKGITRWSPLADWTHDEVLACIHYEGLPLPPCYAWPRGFRVGSGPWPARQWTASEAHGWDEIRQIDPAILHVAAPVFPGAAAALGGRP